MCFGQSLPLRDTHPCHTPSHEAYSAVNPENEEDLGEFCYVEARSGPSVSNYIMGRGGYPSRSCVGEVQDGGYAHAGRARIVVEFSYWICSGCIHWPQAEIKVK